MKTRHELREKIFKILFQIENSQLSVDDILELEQDHIEDKYFEENLKGIIENMSKLDEIISNNLTKWSLNRLSKMDRQILRIATYEILFSNIPYKVSINEAIELSKVYSDKDDSYKFINGVLKGIVQKEIV